jgi:hypothetical protein
MQPQTVTFDLELKDHQALLAHICAPPKRATRLLQFGVVGGVFVAACAASLVVQSVDSFLLGMVAVSLLLAVATRALMRARTAQLVPTSGGSILCHDELALTDDGVKITTPFWRSIHQWEGVVAVEEAADHVFLKVDTVAAYTVPRRAFASNDDFRAFVRTAQLKCRRGPQPSLS